MEQLVGTDANSSKDAPLYLKNQRGKRSSVKPREKLTPGGSARIICNGVIKRKFA